MDAVVGTILGTGWASGVNLYGTVLLLGLFGRLDVATVPEVLENPWVLGVAAAMYALEFVADKVPFVDSLWDTLHTVVRPLGAALLGGELAGEDVSRLLAGGMSGAMALGAHAAKAGARVAINTSPEPATNIGVSLAEDLVVAAMVWFAVTYPWLAGALALVLLVLGTVALVAAWRLVRRGLQRFRHWRARRHAASTLR
jgi:hypothetical protein